MKILHISWGLEKTNGAANIARLIMGEQQKAGHETRFVSRPTWKELRTAHQVWCHCGWYWLFWLVAFYKWAFTFLGRSPATRFYWMPECCYDPMRLKYHGWKKALVSPIERWALRQFDVLVAACEAEKTWILNYVGKKCPPVEVNDIKRFFDLKGCEGKGLCASGELHVLYLGRPHPLKGVNYLEEAVNAVNAEAAENEAPSISMRIISNHAGEELERDWAWCDVMCLPTLSENFGLVIAEALARGKRVITTDGAPAWEKETCENLVYLRGFRAGSHVQRVQLLKAALMAQKERMKK